MNIFFCSKKKKKKSECGTLNAAGAGALSLSVMLQLDDDDDDGIPEAGVPPGSEPGPPCHSLSAPPAMTHSEVSYGNLDVVLSAYYY